ncbi:MAG TPA: class I SAM-dependent methyltransferase [Alphaproteobacteria bacterium]|nr:class I SAM-dependent methyltransferase [Alphaproteobacteria bacterium]
MDQIFSSHRTLLKRFRISSLQEAPFCLLQEVTKTLQERLAFVKKPFNKALLLGPLGKEVIDFNITQDQVVSSPEILCFSPNSFDLALSVFDLSVTNDVPGLLAQVYDCLRPNGLFTGVLLGTKSFQEIRTNLYTLEETLCGRIYPRFDPLVHPSTIVELFVRMPWELPVVDVQDLSLRFLTLQDFISHQRSLGMTHHLPKVYSFNKDLYQALIRLFPKNIDLELIYFSAWKPSVTALEPLRRKKHASPRL